MSPEIDGVIPVDDRQAAAAVERTTPPQDAVRSDVDSLPLPLPISGGVESTLCYAYRGTDGRIALIDPGWDTIENRTRLISWLDGLGANLTDVDLVVATHMHVDHLGMAEWLRDEGGSRIAVARAELTAMDRVDDGDGEVDLDRWGVPADQRGPLRTSRPPHAPVLGDPPEILVEDGDRIDVAGTPLHVVSTPGHTPGSICLVDEHRGLVFTGDHVLPIIHPGLGLGGPAEDPIGDYLNSLDALAPYDPLEVCPAHGYRFHGLGARRHQLAAHHRGRSAEVAAARSDLADPSIWEIAQRISWRDGWDGLLPFLRRSALAQTEMHIRHLDRLATDRRTDVTPR